ncbi:MCP four helix bundle domain-containing protein [Echinicola rosea]|nr:MCP four helix bundle domain-containing protein [Echinicola rosea]
MKWIYSIKSRMTIAVLLMVLFVSVFIKNMLDEENVSELTTSCSTIYQDRLLPESYIYHLSDFLNKKQRLIDKCNDQSDFERLEVVNDGFNAEIDDIMVAFEATYLTPEEATALSALGNNIDALYTVENAIQKGDKETIDFQLAKGRFSELISKASTDLKTLSDIQLTVGKQVNDDSKRIMAGSSILTRFETAILVVLGLVINALVFGLISSKSKIRQRPNWN